MNRDNISLFFSELSFECLDDCLTENEVVSFEGNNNVKIPEQYRNFLLDIRNGLNAIIKMWISGGCKESPEEMAQVIKQEYRGR